MRASASCCEVFGVDAQRTLMRTFRQELRAGFGEILTAS
jgi:hypothetical protein